MKTRSIAGKLVGTAFTAILALCIGLLAYAPVAFADDTGTDTTEAASTETGAVDTVTVAAPNKPTFKVTAKGGTYITLKLSVKGGATGFQVKYREGAGAWTTKTTKKDTIKLKKLEVNHTYKIKVRTYNKADGKTAYSAFSKTKTVFNGVTPLKDSQIKKMWYKRFIHGTKKEGQQRYIMLHDTESYAGPSDIVDGWKSDNGGYVAAHFVVGRNGKVVQTAKMSRILHHAGYGGPGNYDKKFGVGKNNGKGTGDDLKGQVKWAGYTSYGMNSYSIGIEMCHVGGQNYTKKQLKAVDRLIAYIDQSYGGYGGKIIAHNDWRPSNSDTNPEFSKYLKNYKKYRKHSK